MDDIIFSFMSNKIKLSLNKLPNKQRERLEEIRIRIGRPIELIIDSQSYFLTPSGEVTPIYTMGMIADADDGLKIMNLISRHSVYAIEEELRRGYITIKGGHRVGITGRAIMENGKVKLLKDIKSFNIRIARELKGIAEPIFPLLVEKERFMNTLIISPPRCGKTTLLRDLIRLLSKGVPKYHFNGCKVGVVDERSEIASCMEGVPQNDLGPRIDVLDACPKAEGMMMLIRSMSPDVIATDEMGSADDTDSVLEAIHAGVSVLTTVHGNSVEDIKRRPQLRPLFEQPIFERYILLGKSKGVGTVEAILDHEQRKIGQWEQVVSHA
jgi:stage III sporulation protein AA